MSYVWLIDDLRRRYDIESMAGTIAQMIAQMSGQGGDGQVNIPPWYEIRQQFDEQLIAAPAAASANGSEENVVLQALGLR